MTNSTPSWADGEQPTTTSSTTDSTPTPTTSDVPDVPPMPATPPAAAPAAGKTGIRRTLTTLLIGAVAGASIVGGTWYTTSRDNSITVDGKPAAPKGTFTLKGDFTLADGAVDDGIGGCEGSGGYDDIALGTSVTVYDAAGAVIATSALTLSEYDETAGTCTYDVSVPGVPGGEDFYQVEISHRGKIQLSAEEAKSGGFSGSLG
ncbi:hypothetical protein OH782_42465 (plasmid) [Streptomyces sp. NBC_01544]|uniref:hypothetical protein n=1 Tax=Streptomyces sp. NBC_01544 TaxID=2975871 RepID=UPI002F909AD2